MFLAPPKRSHAIGVVQAPYILDLCPTTDVGQLLTCVADDTVVFVEAYMYKASLLVLFGIWLQKNNIESL